MKEERSIQLMKSIVANEDSMRKSFESPLIIKNSCVKSEMAKELLDMGLAKKTVENILNLRIRNSSVSEGKNE